MTTQCDTDQEQIENGKRVMYEGFALLDHSLLGFYSQNLLDTKIPFANISRISGIPLCGAIFLIV